MMKLSFLRLYQFDIFYVSTNFIYLTYPASELYDLMNNVHKLTESLR